MKISWKEWRLGSGWNGRIGRVGTATVAYESRRSQGDPPSETPWKASVFDLRHKTGFASSDEAKAWCERTAEKLLREALGDGGEPS